MVSVLVTVVIFGFRYFSVHRSLRKKIKNVEPTPASLFIGYTTKSFKKGSNRFFKLRSFGCDFRNLTFSEAIVSNRALSTVVSHGIDYRVDSKCVLLIQSKASRYDMV